MAEWADIKKVLDDPNEPFTLGSAYEGLEISLGDT